MTRRPTRSYRGTVEKIIPSTSPNQPEKAQISLEGGEDFYREVRFENVLRDNRGTIVRLRVGEQVQVIIAADCSETTLSE